ncbi:hypothetical protein GCM10010413_16480 [Promicromonospora sukumoe]|uniref:DUF7878 domain-containing protein n=1 Tax=Promicromonospora sukumoe TaxID=88382 RepID=A0A7W3JA84_9MICO|nr:hypothetical protein [Promicromonospora sukumoe]MBA8809131.1 hypothetical protein [Promicromonospora sukumoe]
MTKGLVVMVQVPDEPTALLRFGTVGAPDLPRRIELLRARNGLTAFTGAEVLLDVEADFSVREGAAVVFAERAFPVAELARALELWAPESDEPRHDFSFDSMSYDVPGAVRIVDTGSGWTIGSRYARTTTVPRPWPVVHTEVRAFVEMVKLATAVAVREATGSMITAILAMSRAFDMSLADAKAFVVDAVRGIGPVDQRLHDIVENDGRTGVLGMRVTVVATGEGTTSDVVVDGPAGRLHGSWVGPRPQVGATVDIEVETDRQCEWGDVVLGATSEPRADSDHRSWLRGLAERLDPDGILVLRSGPAVTMVEMTGFPPASVIGSLVAIPVDGARFFPTGV